MYSRSLYYFQILIYPLKFISKWAKCPAGCKFILFEASYGKIDERMNTMFLLICVLIIHFWNIKNNTIFAKNILSIIENFLWYEVLSTIIHQVFIEFKNEKDINSTQFQRYITSFFLWHHCKITSIPFLNQILKLLKIEKYLIQHSVFLNCSEVTT